MSENDTDYKEVIFAEYCSKCEHNKKLEEEDPCYECLKQPVNLWSHKPVNFKEIEAIVL